MNIPRILIAAPSSGSGKTVISCGLMAAFCRQQKNVVSCKCGPDYIDPMFHREVLGIDSQNLDLFFCEKEQLTGIFAEHAKNVDLAVVEGVMGYYDGMGLDTAKASSYDVAAALQIPVVLVVSARGSALSLAALVKGFLEFKKGEPDSGNFVKPRIGNVVSPFERNAGKRAEKGRTSDQGARVYSGT